MEFLGQKFHERKEENRLRRNLKLEKQRIRNRGWIDSLSDGNIQPAYSHNDRDRLSLIYMLHFQSVKMKDSSVAAFCLLQGNEVARQ
jgi:hypothetical protein